MIRELLCLGARDREVKLMRFLAIGLTFSCGAALAQVQSPPPPPSGLTARQASVWNDWTKARGFKNIWIIQFDKSALQSNSITLEVHGKSYRLDGKSTRLKPFLLVDENGRRMVGGVSWSGQSAQGSGTMTETDDGEFGGSFTLETVKVYNVIGADGLTFLVELDQTPPQIAEPEQPAPSVAQTKGGAACAAANQTMRPPQSAVLFGPGSERHFSHWQTRQLCMARASKVQGVEKWRARYVNRLAVDSDVILVDIDRKRYKFVGTNRCSDAPPMDFWSGQASSGDRAEIHRTVENILVLFEIGDRSFTFSAQEAEYGIFWERARTPVVATTPPTIRATPPPTPVDVQANSAIEKCLTQHPHPFLQEKARSESRNVPTKVEMCADLQRSMQMMQLRLRLPQSKYAREQLEKWLAPIKERQSEIHC